MLSSASKYYFANFQVDMLFEIYNVYRYDLSSFIWKFSLFIQSFLCNTFSFI